MKDHVLKLSCIIGFTRHTINQNMLLPLNKLKQCGYGKGRNILKVHKGKQFSNACRCWRKILKDIVIREGKSGGCGNNENVI